MECYPISVCNNSRKKVGDKSRWKKNMAKLERYSALGPPKVPTCKHKGKAFGCELLTKKDVAVFHASFYESKDKIKQDNFLLKYTDNIKPVRSRQTTGERENKNITIKYFVKRYDSKEKLSVCRAAFLGILQISKHRVQGVINRYNSSGCMPKENRGGDTRSKLYKQKLSAVKKFITSIPAVENHYCRSKTAVRVYLSSDLSIRKLWRLYESQVTDESLHVRHWYFRNIFNTHFNIGFGTPRTDACSTCISLDERRKIEDNPEKKNQLLVEKRVHLLKAKAFYNLLREKKENLIIFSFDCQKNMVLPKVPDQTAYYSRQLYQYNLTVVIGDSKCHQTKENTFIYEWKETEYSKSSNEIASAVYHCICQHNFAETISTVRLVSDGCGGQNKNSIMIAMLFYWLSKDAPAHITMVELLFPMVGHSFLPPDRVFARIEKNIRKKEVIADPIDYVKVFAEHGTVISLKGLVRDWKSIAEIILKKPGHWHFKFNPSKRFFIRKNQDGIPIIRGEVHYRSNFGKSQSVFKKGN